MSIRTDFLIIGAGPFGLSAAAYAKHLNIDYKIVGRPLEFWKNNMPANMRLRSGPDWHLDPLNNCTIESFFEYNKIERHQVNPLPIRLYLDYLDWFIEQKGIEPITEYVSKLDYLNDSEYRFRAYLSDNEYIEAKTVLIAIGFGYFKHIPTEFSSGLPDHKYSHTAELVEFSSLKSKDCIIVGGRQSAFESALLMKEFGVGDIDIIHRHKTPKFTESDWGWVTPLLGKMKEQPDYYLNLDEHEKERINNRFWQEGRLKLEPWLNEIEQYRGVKIHAEKQIVSTAINKEGKIEAVLNDGTNLSADHILFATGYKVDITKVPFLKNGSVLNNLNTDNGYPRLRTNFESSVSGLYFTSLVATADYGAFFGFTVSCNTSAIIIGNAIKSALR